MTKGDSVLNYFKSGLNYIDMLQYLGTLWVILNDLFDVDLLIIMDKRILCLIVILCQGIKAILDWLRLFDSTSFYVTLI